MWSGEKLHLHYKLELSRIKPCYFKICRNKPKLIFPQITSIRDGVAKLLRWQMDFIIEWLFSVYGYWVGPWVLLTFSIACQYC